MFCSNKFCYSYDLDEPPSNRTDFSKSQCYYEFGEPMHHRENCTKPGHVVFTVSTVNLLHVTIINNW